MMKKSLAESSSNIGNRVWLKYINAKSNFVINLPALLSQKRVIFVNICSIRHAEDI